MRYAIARLIFAWLLLVGVLASCAPDTDETLEPPTPAVPTEEAGYRFPIQPGSAEWLAMRSHQERVAALQIPHQQLSALSTRELVVTYLNFPLALNIRAHNTFQQGFDSLVRDFNGLRELLDRPDAAAAAAELYGTMRPGAVDPAWGSAERFAFAERFVLLELLLAQDALLGQLDGDQRQKLLQEVEQQRQEQAGQPALFGLTAREPLAYLAGRLLQRHSPEFQAELEHWPQLQHFLQGTGSSVDTTVDVIFHYLGAAAEQDPAPTQGR